MKKIVIVGVFAVIVALFSPAPAQATSCFLGFCQAGVIAHGEDGGYDADILIGCAKPDGTQRVEENTSSDPDCDGEFSDMNRITVRDNEELWCKGLNAPWWDDYELLLDRADTYTVGDGFAKRCVLHRD